ncbi:MAG: two-component sensor histidine kinase [Gammaproteobacteria bacterium]|nr:two-component sensor histidine kinase [Gammaproteobacteria bacterium]
MTSIRRYLVTILIAVLTLTSFMAALQSYRQSISRSDLLFDQDLVLLASSLLPQFQHHTASNNELLVIQVWQGETLKYQSQRAPTQRISAPVGFSEQNFAGQRWRTYVSQTLPEPTSNVATLNQEVAKTPSTTAVRSDELLTIVVAQPLKQRQELADEVVLASIYPVVLSLPLQALLIWFVVSKGLQPLRRLTQQLSLKKADDLTPLQLPEVPQEMTQMLATTNHLLQRLDNAFLREKRFASDVAHELRTPLTVLQVTLHNAQQQWLAQGVSDPDGLMDALKHGVTRMSQLIEQIMVLNRTNPEHFKAKLQAIDVTALCREVIGELYPQILAKQQHIVLEAEDSLMLAADHFALRVLLINIVGNASKYTPNTGQIKVQLQRLGDKMQLIVEDSGPGIAPEEYSRVFDRFYRVGGDRHQSGTPGSGLGLAIVKEIVALHHGHLTLGRSSFSTGLKVTVDFPG